MILFNDGVEFATRFKLRFVTVRCSSGFEGKIKMPLKYLNFKGVDKLMVHGETVNKLIDPKNIVEVTGYIN